MVARSATLCPDEVDEPPTLVAVRAPRIERFDVDENGPLAIRAKEAIVGRSAVLRQAVDKLGNDAVDIARAQAGQQRLRGALGRAVREPKGRLSLAHVVEVLVPVLKDPEGRVSGGMVVDVDPREEGSEIGDVTASIVIIEEVNEVPDIEEGREAGDVDQPGAANEQQPFLSPTIGGAGIKEPMQIARGAATSYSSAAAVPDAATTGSPSVTRVRTSAQVGERPGC